MDINYIILSNSLLFEESGYSAQTAHKLVKLLPLGLVHSTKGDFLVDNESFQAIRCRATAFEVKRKEYQEDAVDSKQRQNAFSGY